MGSRCVELALSVLLFVLSAQLAAAAQASPSASGDVVPSAAAPTPFLVQHRTDAHDLAGMAESAIWTNLPNPSVAGNCLIVTVYYSGATPTVNDDKNNSYTQVITQCRRRNKKNHGSV